MQNTINFVKHVGRVLAQTSKQQSKLVSGRCLATVASNPGDVVGHDLPDFVMKYDDKDVILYNIGVGASLGSGHSDVLRFLHERDASFSALPTFGTLAINGFLDLMYEGKFPLKLDFSKLFHGEHYIELFRRINPQGATLTNKTKVVDAVDKGKGSVLVFDMNTYDEAGAHISRNQSVVYTTQFAGWGGKRASDHIMPSVRAPDRAPDESVTDTTSVDQAALYRLTGDTNPFHIDPMTAAIGGFPRPILHGLCTYGFSARNIIDKFCDNETSKFKSSKLRFSKPVLPGQSIRTDMWKEGSRVHFTTTVPETGDVVISGAHVDLVE